MSVERHKDHSLSRSNDPRCFVWLQTGFIGDIVLMTGALELAHRRFPEARHFLITTAAGEAIFRDHPRLSATIIFDKRSGSVFAAFSQVKKSLYQALETANLNSKEAVLMQVHLSQRSSLLAKHLRIPRITFQEAAWSRGAMARVTRVAVFHEVHRQAMLLEALRVPRAEILATEVELPTSEVKLPQEWGEWFSCGSGRVVALSPGSVWGTKRWPETDFAQVLLWVLKQTTDRIVLLGSQNESALCDAVLKVVQSASKSSAIYEGRVLNLAGKTTLTQLRSLYPKLAALIANDSSAIHFASAFRVPTIALFGSTIPQMGFAPRAPKSQSIGIDLSCRPCGAHGPQTCPLVHFRCMRDLSPNSVIDALKAILA